MNTEEARDEVLKWLDKAFWGRTDAQAAHQWEQAEKAVDALIAAVRAEHGDRQRQPTDVSEAGSRNAQER